jgi:hypothetical protein
MIQSLIESVTNFIAQKGEFPEFMTLELPAQKTLADLDHRPKIRLMTWKVHYMPIKPETIQVLKLEAAKEDPPMTWQQFVWPQLMHMTYFECVNDETKVDLTLQLVK